MNAQQRRWRSKLAQLASQHGLMHGCLLERERVCGKPNCRCTRGHKHRSLYLVMTKKGRLHQLYVPKPWEADVRQWVQNYREMQDLMEKISEGFWNKVRTRQG